MQIDWEKNFILKETKKIRFKVHDASLKKESLDFNNLNNLEIESDYSSIWNGNVTNAYSSANVTGSIDVGGLVGLTLFASLVNSFWDTQTSGQATSAGGIGKTTAEMKTALTFVGNCWDFQAETGNGEPSRGPDVVSRIGKS